MLDKLDPSAELPAPQLPPRKKKSKVALGYNEIATKNPLVPKVKLADEGMEELPLPSKDDLNDSLLGTSTSISAKKRNREAILQKFRSSKAETLDPFAKSAMECGLGPNAKEAERRVAELAARGWHFSHLTKTVSRDTAPKIKFISDEENFKDMLQKKLQQQIRNPLQPQQRADIDSD